MNDEHYHAASSLFAPWMLSVDRRPHNPRAKKEDKRLKKV